VNSKQNIFSQHATFQAWQATRNPAKHFFARFYTANFAQPNFLYRVTSKTIWCVSGRIGKNRHESARFGTLWQDPARLVPLGGGLESGCTRFSGNHIDKVDFEVGMRRMSNMIMMAGRYILAMPEAARNAIGIGVGGILVVLAMGAGVLLARRYYVRSQGECERGGLGIDDLQRIYEAGHLTKEEFSRLRRVAMGLEESTAENSKSTSSHPVKVDDVKRDNEDTSSAY